MKRFFGMLFVVMTVVTLLAIPAAVSAGALATDCTFDKVKWQDNPNSWYLYLNNWGKTPPNAMSRLAGLQMTTFNPSSANKSCGTATTATCSDCAKTGYVWGVSSCFANKSWAGADISNKPRLDNNQPNHRGSATCVTTVSGKGEPCGSLFCANGPCKTASGGDWGISGCAHPQCAADNWCFTNNLITGKK